MSAVAGLLAQVTITRTSHTAAMEQGGCMVASDFAHLAAGALWGGGLAALLIAMRSQPGDGLPASATRSLIRRFSPLGIAGVALAVGTGLMLSAVHIPNVDGLRATSYGGILVAKIILVIGAVALAALHKFVTARHMRTNADVRRFSRTLGVELLIVGAVLAAAAMLTSTEPPRHTITHHLADGSTHVATTSDPDFERSLRVTALAILVAGVVACALDWRARLPSQS
jgi:putative copper export protein